MALGRCRLHSGTFYKWLYFEDQFSVSVDDKSLRAILVSVLAGLPPTANLDGRHLRIR